MQLKTWVLTPTLASILLLAACGTNSTSGEVDEVDTSNGSEQVVNQQEDSTEETTEVSEEGTETNPEEDTKIRLLERQLTYSKASEEIETTAFLKNSDNQPFSLYVLPEYELTAEEPFKDVVYLSEDSSVFMRIETLPADSDIAFVLENTKQQLAVTNEDVNDFTSDKHSEWLPGKNQFVAENANSKVISVVDEAKKIKFTIFTTPDDQWTDALLSMAGTIEVTE
ncbi:hypothetical protein [Mangrovibacillus cuniculi]|uniref:Lipoprotein n=1 Tax=Mangrovibacillus cuniculi TaxID=2593652 RepID=A0A7S8C9Z8_9BACI|nr:hypothetical protein [Mangrovibacillus cuniculi]QPC46149.1 hypothetical protein G8O30_03835 [Mangrovibacillus cuniculi]